MIQADVIRNEYFEWLYEMVDGRRFMKQYSFRKLLTRLHDTEFRYSILKDQNRAEDGISLRYRFANDRYFGVRHERNDIVDYLDGPCSVLEMMVALAIRCEENIMDDPLMGNRTSHWFWQMVVNLGLGPMADGRYERQAVDDAINRFLDREYEPDGRGGLFRVRNSDVDMRNIEIWHQLCCFLNTIV
jgi:hypothetical protein